MVSGNSADLGQLPVTKVGFAWHLTQYVERHEPLTLLVAKTSGNKKITSFNSDPNVKHF